MFKIRNIGVITGEWGYDYGEKIKNRDIWLENFISEFETLSEIEGGVFNKYHFHNGGILWKMEQILRENMDSENEFDYLIFVPQITLFNREKHIKCLSYYFKKLIEKKKSPVIITNQLKVITDMLVEYNFQYDGKLVDIEHYKKQTDDLVLENMMTSILKHKLLLS